jgi:hypothetical protein
MRQGVIATTLVAACVTASTTAALAFQFGDGTHRVGVDIPAGTYRAPDIKRAPGPFSPFCEWARLRNFSGRTDSFLAFERTQAPTIVTIKSTDRGFDAHACKRWTSDLSRITKSTTRFGPGTYIVKTDIKPGAYVARCSSSGYWARLRAFTGDARAIIAEASPSGRTKVTISRTDRGFKSQGCGTWSTR